MYIQLTPILPSQKTPPSNPARHPRRRPARPPLPDHAHALPAHPPLQHLPQHKRLQKDSAGLTSAWSAAYLVLAGRRKQTFGSKFGARGLVRGATVGLCLANIVGGGLAYAFGKREADDA